MKHRKLGGTGLEVGVIGLGAEHLEHAPRETVLSVVHEALDYGVDYIDLFMGSPDVRDNFGLALKGRVDDIIVAGHLGAVWLDNQYAKTRDRAICEDFFHDLLRRLGTDHINLLMLHFVDDPDDCDSVLSPGGLLAQALRYKAQGKARAIGMSGHMVPAARRIVESGQIDVLMFPVNPLFDRLPGEAILDDHWKDSPYAPLREEGRIVSEREELYHACVRQGVSIVAMKAYAAGWLFQPENAGGVALTPVQCLHYALSQPGVSTAVPGCKTVEEMRAALAYLEAGGEEKDYAAVTGSPLWRERDSCMYCNHCLPCPAGIDIAAVTRLADSAVHGMTDAVMQEYSALGAKAGDCLDCGQCSGRCPFGIDPAANMRRAVEIFG